MRLEQLELAHWLESYRLPIFATWTFGKKWPDGPSPESVEAHVKLWVRSLRIKPAFFVVERGWSGARRWHAHGLLGTIEDQPIEWSRQQMWNDWRKRYGRCSFLRLEPEHGAEWYVAKYCAKGVPLRWWITVNGRWE